VCIIISAQCARSPLPPPPDTKTVVLQHDERQYIIIADALARARRKNTYNIIIIIIMGGCPKKEKKRGILYIYIYVIYNISCTRVFLYSPPPLPTNPPTPHPLVVRSSAPACHGALFIIRRTRQLQLSHRVMREYEARTPHQLSTNLIRVIK